MVVRDDVAEPVPAAGQVLVEVRACGICGSDLHFARHGHRAVEVIDPYPTSRKKVLDGSVPWVCEKNGVKAFPTLSRPS